MASTFSPLGVELMATGENAGTWGAKTNTNLQLVEQILGGFTQQSIAGGAGTTALTITDNGTGDTAGHRMIEFTGTISGNRIVTIPNDVQTFYILRNSTSGSHTVEFKYATGSGSSFTFASTDKGDKIVFAAADDGSNPNILTLAIGTGIANVVEDTTPQLGGNLDVNGNNIVSTSNGAINIVPNGTGVVSIQGSMNPSVSGTGKTVAFGF
jgi:dipeptidyl aminopeptidase/acylaminoacyl peptidase|tara:strand:- start:384 stop:1016 length:633 start_codon:yes stop_codon:yes gene_type:complete